ncbi:MAG: hypothetical protein WBG42_10115 [Cryomorphaceae bacterium]
MKTINQVLLALIFAAFSTAGFAQSQTNSPGGILNRDIDGPQNYLPIEDEEEDDEDDNDDTSVITEDEWRSQQYLVKRKSNAIIYRGYSDYMLNQQ